jgi:type II secretory pathway predicted ATPase ExeA
VGQPVGLTDLLCGLAEAWGMEGSCRRGKSAQLLSEGLEKLASSGSHPVLVLDEAQQLPIQSIEFLRLVSESHNRTLLSLVLVGADPFARHLARPALAPLAGRLAVHVRLRPLTPDQTAHFIDNAFTAAGISNLLDPTALAGLHAASAGSPRRIGAFLAQAMQRALDNRHGKYCGSRHLSDSQTTS